MGFPLQLVSFDSEDEHRAVHRQSATRVFAELTFAPFGLADWKGDRAMAWCGGGSAGIAESRPYIDGFLPH